MKRLTLCFGRSLDSVAALTDLPGALWPRPLIIIYVAPFVVPLPSNAAQHASLTRGLGFQPRHSFFGRSISFMPVHPLIGLFCP